MSNEHSKPLFSKMDYEKRKFGRIPGPSTFAIQELLNERTKGDHGHLEEAHEIRQTIILHKRRLVVSRTGTS